MRSIAMNMVVCLSVARISQQEGRAVAGHHRTMRGTESLHLILTHRSE